MRAAGLGRTETQAETRRTKSCAGTGTGMTVGTSLSEAGIGFLGGATVRKGPSKRYKQNHISVF